MGTAGKSIARSSSGRPARRLSSVVQSRLLREANRVDPIAGGWAVSLDRDKRIASPLVIDASGRRSRFDNSTRSRDGKLCCARSG